MRGRDRFPTSVRRVIAAAAGTLLVLTSCAGPATSPAGSAAAGSTRTSADAIARAEQALAQGQMWDPKTGETVAKPISRMTITTDAFLKMVEGDATLKRHLDLAREMGYGTIGTVGQVAYDNGSIVTAALLAGKTQGDAAVLVRSTAPTEGVIIARPVFKDGKLSQVVLTGEKGTLTLDVATGHVDVEGKYGSCMGWNCLAGAIAFWWEDNSSNMTAYWDTCGETCLDCLALPLTQEVTCPACAVMLAAVGLASFTECTLWPCDLCVSDACHAPDEGDTRCVTGVGSTGAAVVRTVTPWQCENAGSQTSECVQGTSTTQIVEECHEGWGCAANGLTCNVYFECIPSLQNCAPETVWGVCNGNTATSVSQRRRCEAIKDPITGADIGGYCVAIAGDTQTSTYTCPYACYEGGCLPAPTCQASSCTQDEPLGEPACVVRPDDGKSIVQQQYQQYGCTTVQPNPSAPGGPWSAGSTCAPTTVVTRAVKTCPGVCTNDGKACAPTCSSSTCSGEVAGATSCSYDYRRYKLYQSFDTKVCQPQSNGGSACGTTAGGTREVGLCPFGCTADRSDCAADTGVPEAPGGFIALEGSAAGKTEFLWTDNSPDEQGFHIYYGGCFATPARPCQLIATVAANKVRLLLDWQRTGSDTCWEIRAFNATGESAPAWYCLPG